MDETTSCCKVGILYPLFFTKDCRKALKGKIYRNLQIDFITVSKIGASCDIPVTRFYSHKLFDSVMEQGRWFMLPQGASATVKQPS